jgi:hypothetical protein
VKSFSTSTGFALFFKDIDVTEATTPNQNPKKMSM